MVLHKLSSALLALLEADSEAKSGTKDLPKIDYWRTVAGRPVGFVGPQGSGVPVTAGPLLAPKLFATSDAARKKQQRDRMSGATAAASRQAEKATVAYLESQEVMVSAVPKSFDRDMKQAALGMTEGIMKELRRKEYKDKSYQKYLGAVEDGMKDAVKTLPDFTANSIMVAVRTRVTEVVAKERGITDLNKASYDDYNKVSDAVSGIVRELSRDIGKAHLASLLVLAEQNAKEYGAPIETEQNGILSIKHGCMDVRLPYTADVKGRSDAIKTTIKTILTISSPALFTQKSDAELRDQDRKELKDYIGTPYYAATRKKFEELSAQFVEKQRAMALERMSRGDAYSSSGVRIGSALTIMSRIATNSPEFDYSPKLPNAEAASVGYRAVEYDKYMQSMVDSPYTTSGRTLASRAIPRALRQNSRYPSNEAYDVVYGELGKNYAHDAVASKELVNRYFDVLAEVTAKHLAEDLDQFEAIVANPTDGALDTPKTSGSYLSRVSSDAAIDCLQLMSNIYEHSTSGEPTKPKDWVRFASNDYRNDIKPQFTRAFATRSAQTTGIVSIEFGGKNDRSYATTSYLAGEKINKIVVLEDYRGDNFVIAHELGHAMEHSVRQISECSMKFLGRLKDTSGGGKDVPMHLGQRDNEVGYRDNLTNHYTGKVYSDKSSHDSDNFVKNQSTEVWSTTVEKLGKQKQHSPESSFVDTDFRMTALLQLHGTRGDLLDAKRSKGKAQPIAPKPREEEPAPKPQPKPEPRPEPKPEPRPEPKPEPKPQPRPEPKPQPKPEPKPKPPAKPEPAKPTGRKFDRSKMRDDVTYIGRR
jgi:hypothetical protein